MKHEMNHQHEQEINRTKELNPEKLTRHLMIPQSDPWERKLSTEGGA
jgi:hypothetical protein